MDDEYTHSSITEWKKNNLTIFVICPLSIRSGREPQ